MKKWKKQEKEVNKRLGGKLTIGSGNKFQKGDLQGNNYLVECKSTEKNQFILKKEILVKLKNQAFEVGKTPVLSLEICDEKWLMLELNFLEELLKGDF